MSDALILIYKHVLLCKEYKKAVARDLAVKN
jgi:hypothetical protein